MKAPPGRSNLDPPLFATGLKALKLKLLGAVGSEGRRIVGGGFPGLRYGPSGSKGDNGDNSGLQSSFGEGTDVRALQSTWSSGRKTTL